ncbi:MAG: oligosaccharide flippase family protein [Flavobacteriaceae bacterium]|nr:oligosaccharide flippase family protein [Flavobacteriaceae bacterium]
MGNKSFIKDFSWYFLGSFIPVVIGLIKTPIFTRHFDREAFGHLGLVTITFSYFGMVLFSWIASCIWRYYHKYDDAKNLKKLYSNLGFLLVVSITIVTMVSMIWYSTSENALTKQLVFYSVFQLIFNQLFLCYMVVVRLQGRARFYTIVHSIKAIVAIAGALVLVFIYNQNISALILSLAVVDFLAIFILILINPSDISLKVHLINKSTLRELLIYGSAGLIINIGFLIITSSDRYIIAWLTTIENVGVYDQVYKISQLSVWALVTIYFNTINPYLLNQLEKNFKQSDRLIRTYLQPFFLYGLPVIAYLSIFSIDIASILLGAEFREGYVIMPFIFIAAYLHGISNFYELRLKFANKLKRLTSIISVSVLLNVLITYFLVQFYGYKSAAVTSVLIYLFMIMVFHYYDRQVASFSRHDNILLLKIVSVIICQIILFIVLKNSYQLEFFHKIILGLLFMASYFIIFRKYFLTLKIPVHD